MDMVNRVIFSFEVLKLNRIWQKREPFFSNGNSEALNATQLMERDEEGSLNVVMQKQNILYAKASFGLEGTQIDN
ncbi:hypothetical protein IMY05_014G0019700 [Salix suchowensis]|nr:hypothetical protein IMY05_014G0019700 [Salix suchowensis]